MPDLIAIMFIVFIFGRGLIVECLGWWMNCLIGVLAQLIKLNK